MFFFGENASEVLEADSFQTPRVLSAYAALLPSAEAGGGS